MKLVKESIRDKLRGKSTEEIFNDFKKKVDDFLNSISDKTFYGFTKHFYSTIKVSPDKFERVKKDGNKYYYNIDKQRFPIFLTMFVNDMGESVLANILFTKSKKYYKFKEYLKKRFIERFNINLI